MNCIDKNTRSVRVNILVYAVAKVKDVPTARTKAGENCCHLLADSLR